MRVLIIGAGIGGLTAAAALIKAGVDAHVFDQREQLKEVGAGIGVFPNGAQVLYRLGLRQTLENIGARPTFSIIKRWADGTVAQRQSLRRYERAFGASTYLLHRADLQEALLSALPEHVVHLGCRCISIKSFRNGVEVVFENGHVASGDLLIGADGIASMVRPATGNVANPVFAGVVAYRGLIPVAHARALGIGDDIECWRAPRRMFLHYPAGPRFLNIVGDVPTASWPFTQHKMSTTAQEFLDAVGACHPLVARIISAAEHLWKMPMYCLEPLERWTSGRITLLGDAAHAVWHFIAQGAALAIEDAEMLTLCLTGGGSDPEMALQTYESLRRPRATSCQKVSEAMRQTFLDNPQRRGPSTDRVIDFDRLYGYDVERVYRRYTRILGAP